MHGVQAPDATTIALGSSRIGWLPALTSVVFVGLAGTMHATRPELAASYRDPLVQTTAVLVAVAAALLAALALGGRPAAGAKDVARVRTDTTLWLMFAVVVAGWLGLVETSALLRSGASTSVSAVAPWIAVSCLATRAPWGRTALAALARSRSDGMTGLRGLFLRPIITRRSREAVRGYLAHVKRQVEAPVRAAP
jgi:hypothetical protein